MATAAGAQQLRFTSSTACVSNTATVCPRNSKGASIRSCSGRKLGRARCSPTPQHFWSFSTADITPLNHIKNRGTSRNRRRTAHRAAAIMAIPVVHPPVERAVVVGGGLGGLATALSLRSKGIDAHVYEKRESIGGGEGTLILLAPNGLHALSQIHPDLVPKMMAAGCCDPKAARLGPDGSLLGEASFSGTQGDDSTKYGFPFVCIAWNAALEIMRDLLPPSCLHLGRSFLGLSQNTDEVTAKFSLGDGTEETVHAPLLVGCDGIRSEVRSALLGIDSKDHIVDLGRTLWRAMVDFEKFQYADVMRGRTSFIMGGDRIFTLADAGSNQLYMAFTLLDSAWPSGERKRTADGHEAALVLRGFFQNMPLALHALGIVDPAKLLERRIQECPLLEKWSQGRVVLIGDAAHAMPPSLGQGANSVFEDAWELGEVLCQHPDLRTALESFEGFPVPRLSFIMGVNTAQAKAAYGQKEAGGGGDSNSNIYNYKGHQQSLASVP